MIQLKDSITVYESVSLGSIDPTVWFLNISDELVSLSSFVFASFFVVTSSLKSGSIIALLLLVFHFCYRLGNHISKLLYYMERKNKKMLTFSGIPS